MGIDVAPAQLSNGNGLNTPLVSVYTRRWLVLGSFCLLSLMNGMQWVQYAIISDSVAKFYDVSPQAVDWASMIYMLTYIPFILPASWMLDNKGLRCTVLLAGALNCLASWVKAASGQRDLYAVTMAGQTLAGITQAFILAVPSRLAAVWFGPGEVATACAIGVFGNQVGNAVGFLVPPLIVSGYETMDDLGFQLRTVFYGVAGVSTFSLLLLLAVFQDAPLVPPSIAQARVLSSRTDRSSNWELLQSMRRMMRTPGFGLLVISYGISVGVYYAISTLLNALIKSVFKAENSTDAGNIGLLIVVAGLLGSLLCGLLLDVTRKYKEVTLSIYLLSFGGMIAFAASFYSSSIWMLYISGSFLGFFLTGYLPLGFELAAELTYPEPEGTSAGLLNVSAQVFGLIFSELCGLPLEVDNATGAHLWVNASLCAALCLGSVLTALVPGTLRRQAAQSSCMPPESR
ncbi:feline leukemia virus subgroup C receptor-related protein 1 isoform X1 [Frankliniella occidentalis]|uniref:Feline leukemia virus subgroup C receptor-related protein 1 isoform X1 n=2 Tax=Frankliniella occidentalis TaxID=133901 RepID=A0A6J1S6M6_FRAOC|nr:feline leukemia virus subgroup C receptor-related protein 1 isoform X1 [Frankliniella occidentalis]